MLDDEEGCCPQILKNGDICIYAMSVVLLKK